MFVFKRADKFESAWHWRRAHHLAGVYIAFFWVLHNSLWAYSTQQSDLRSYCFFVGAVLMLVFGVSIRLTVQLEPVGRAPETAGLPLMRRIGDVISLTTTIAVLVGTIAGLAFSRLPVERADNVTTCLIAGLAAGLFYLIVSLAMAVTPPDIGKIEARFEKEKARLAERMSKYGY